jgi:heptosyltransferase-1
MESSKVTELLKLDREDPSILIILMGSLGDVTRGLALAHQIKTSFPKSKLTWLVEPACKTIVSLNRYIDRIIVYNRPSHFLALPQLIKDLRKEKFDLTLDLQRHFKSGLFSLLSGAKKRVGFYPSNSKEFNYLFNNDYIRNFPKQTSKISHYLAFIEKLGKEMKMPLDFGLGSVKEKPEQKEKLALLPRPYVGLVLGSSWESKDWPVESYIELGKKILTATSFNLVLFGDKTQGAIADLVEAGISNSKRVFNFAGKTSLADVVAMIDESAFMIGPDSGPGHISGALGKKYVSLFGPTDPSLTAPFGSEELVLRSNLACMPCYKRSCPGLGKLCMHLITPQMVFEKAMGIAEG